MSDDVSVPGLMMRAVRMVPVVPVVPVVRDVRTAFHRQAELQASGDGDPSKPPEPSVRARVDRLSGKVA